MGVDNSNAELIKNVSIPLRVASREDFLTDNKKAKYGVPFWLQRTDGTFDVGPHLFNKQYSEEISSPRIMSDLLKQKRIYVCVGYFEMIDLKQNSGN